MTIDTRFMKNNKIKKEITTKKHKLVKKEKIIKNVPPKNKKYLYNWLKKNNLLLTGTQIEKLGLKNDSKKVIWYEYVVGCPECKWEKIYAVAPDGYHWLEDLDVYKKDDNDFYNFIIKKRKEKDDSFMEFFREAICQCFILEKDK